MSDKEMTNGTRRFNALLVREPPEQLFHYTDQAGLLGIVQSGEFWATKVQYMNDTTEFGLAVKLARQRLDNKRKNSTNKNHTMTLNTILKRHHNITNINICVVSFCENHDLLSQWRGYASSGGGVAVGFKSTALIAAAQRGGGRLGHCIYDKQDQIAIIDGIIDDVLLCSEQVTVPYEIDRSDDKEFFEDMHFLPIAVQFDTNIIEYGAFFKDDGFREESEWRLVTGVVSYVDEKLCFRVGKSMLTPYYKIPIHKSTWDAELSSVTVGPCPHPDDSRRAVHGLLMKHGISDGYSNRFRVDSSKIPYRNW